LGREHSLVDVLSEPDPTTLERLLQLWFGEPQAPGVVSGRSDLPQALAAGLSTLSRWPQTFRQNHLDRANEVTEVDGLAVFLTENQGLWMAGVELAEIAPPDAPVWLSPKESERRVVDTSCWSFLLKATLQELAITTPGLAIADGDADCAIALGGLAALDHLGPATVLWTVRFYVGPQDLAMEELVLGYRRVYRVAVPRATSPGS
jgi:hypothetical protein